MEPSQFATAIEDVKGSLYMPRDALMASMAGNYVECDYPGYGHMYPRKYAVQIQNTLDTISQVEGTVLYRGPVKWDALYPGTKGQVLSTQGAGQIPKWVDQSGGGGAGGWTNLTLSATSQPKWDENVFGSQEQISLVAGDVIEAEIAFHHLGGRECSIAISPDGEKCYIAKQQSDNNWVLYRYDSASGSATLLSGGSFQYSHDGTMLLSLSIAVAAVDQSHALWAQRFRAATTKFAYASSTVTPLDGQQVKVWCAADADAVSNVVYARYRVASAP